jgi:16S rRNA (adenine1518-N6/adenine1519-N6)-dimethyltransferase
LVGINHSKVPKFAKNIKLKDSISMRQNRQTVSYLSRRFEEVGLNPNKRHGQNFLIDLNLIQLLARSAQLTDQDVVLEIGTGTGSLTGMLAEQAAAVVTVEIDQFLHQMAREELERFTNIEFLKQDALKNKNQIHPNVYDAVRRQLAVDPDRRFKVAANLPYNVATPIISNLLRSDLYPDTITVTIQKELADRLMASPGTKDYGSLSVWVQSLCDVELVRVMSPKVFWPRPKVDSAIIHIIHREEKRQQIPDLDYFLNFVRSMYFHRRKYMRSVAVSAFQKCLQKADVDRILADQGFSGETRTEQLTIPQMQRLCEAFRKKTGSNIKW